MTVRGGFLRTIDNELRQCVRGFRLLMEGRTFLFLGADLLLLFQGLMVSFIGNGELAISYFSLVLLPLVVLGVPLMSNAVPLERRAGCLDVVLSSPRPGLVFSRRIGTASALMVVQGWMMLGIVQLLGGRPFAAIPIMVFTSVVGVLAGAISLFWNLYLKSTSAVAIASLITLGLFGRWVFAVPEADQPIRSVSDLDWLLSCFAMVVGAALFFLYASRRLLRVEKLLAT